MLNGSIIQSGEMSNFRKQSAALFLNFALFANQVGAELQKVTFEATDSKASPMITNTTPQDT